MSQVQELQAELRALKKARASGALIVRHGDAQITYRSVEELNKAIEAVTKELNAAKGKKRHPRYLRQSGRGY